jgi:hypothetical protein
MLASVIILNVDTYFALARKGTVTRSARQDTEAITKISHPKLLEVRDGGKYPADV